MRNFLAGLFIGLTVAVVAGCSGAENREAAQERVRREKREALRDRGTVRVIAHHANPMILYVTTLPDPSSWSDDDPKEPRLAVVDASTGQWRDLDLPQELKARFGLDHPRVFFEVSRGPNQVVISRE